MKFTFKLDFLPPSVNDSRTLSTRTFYKGGRLITKKVIVKNDKTKDEIKLINEALFYQANKRTIDLINKELKDCHISIKFYFLSNQFITKKGKISKTGGDYDNFIKIFQDCLFSHLEVNDSQINHAEIFLICSDRQKSIVTIEKSTIYNDADLQRLLYELPV